MPEDGKKKQHTKNKNDPKDQRKPRQSRNQPSQQEKVEKKAKEQIATASEKPRLEEPGPEFYSGLKRETDEILKITEEANSKYKKKEIKSNWAKYEMPIESYDDFEKQENMGADYETLIQAPLTVGGHFQFKHEKSWDVTTGPSLYDKYFDINMSDLNIAISTIPFYDRNCIDKSIFSENDIQNMDHRTTRFKHKYFKITTPESEIHDKLIKSLKENSSEDDHSNDIDCGIEETKESHAINLANIANDSKSSEDVASSEEKDKINIIFEKEQEHKISNNSKPSTNEDIDDIDALLLGKVENIDQGKKSGAENQQVEVKIPKDKDTAASELKGNPVIESPEDLEKWLDDFLEE